MYYCLYVPYFTTYEYVVDKNDPQARGLTLDSLDSVNFPPIRD